MAARKEFEFTRDMTLYQVRCLVREMVVKYTDLYQYLKKRRIFCAAVRAIAVSTYAFVIPKKGNFIIKSRCGFEANPLRLFDAEYMYMHKEINWQKIINDFCIHEYAKNYNRNR